MSTNMDASHVVNTNTTAATDAQHHNKKNRNFLLMVLFLVIVIVVLLTSFLTAIIYRAIRSGKARQSLVSTYVDVNSTCVCQWGAICIEQNQCQCRFNCTDKVEYIRDNTTGKWYLNQCQFDQEKCKSFYERINLTCSTISCSHGAQCSIDKNGNPGCSCPTNCDEYLRTTSFNGSICASDHQTYSTICELNKKACERQEELHVVYEGKCQDCQDSNCTSKNETCDPYRNCSVEYRPVCASNFHNYSNECQMQKVACQLNINLTKLHDGMCSLEEQQRLHEVCQSLSCSNGRTCVISNEQGTCECLFNCSSERNQVCASNGMVYQNLCQLERDRCIRNEDFQPVDNANCCDLIHCPYGQCQQQSNGNIQCECPQCSNHTSNQEVVCGDNGMTYPSKCFLEHDACTRQIDIKARHLGECNNCQDIVCLFHGRCQLEQGTYKCTCPTRDQCQTSRTNYLHTICGSNQELFYSQCEMDVRSCELQTHLYAIAPHYCTKQTEETEYNEACDYDEQLLDLTSNRSIECDTIDRCPFNSYCNKKTNRCCVKVITAISPFRMCLDDEQCGRNMICKNGFCQCANENLMPVKHKRECISFLLYPNENSSCHSSPFRCCRDNQTISPTFDRRGCPEHCNCHPTGSLRTTCDPETGSCYCRPGVTSSSCSQCENEYWAFSRIVTHNNTGCSPCGCHPYGSTRRDCLQDTGQCLCQPYATGRQCERCLDPSTILTDRGCVKMRYHQRTCQDLRCSFDGICEMINSQPRCTCFHIVCARHEQYLTNICASDGRTYKSQCEIKRQQCIKQHEIVPVYPGVCHGTDDDPSLDNDDDYPFDEQAQRETNDPKRCAIDKDCGENMVCLSEFCECAKQKYQRIAGPKCIMPQYDHSELSQTHTPTSTRQTLPGICSQQNLCENQATCQDEVDGSYQCLCPYGWTGRYCNEKIDITIPHFNRQSYLELNPSESIRSIDLIFTSERRHGLIFYWEKKSREFYWIISLRNRILELIILSDQLSSTIPLSDSIDLHTFIRLQIQILHNEIQIKLNEGQILPKLFPFEISLQDQFYLGGIPQQLNFFYSKSFLGEGFQGCMHYLSINGREILFNHSQFLSQNIKQCLTNLCRSKSCQKEVYSSSIDRCLINPCERNEQCVNVYPNNYLCICRNCSSDRRYTAGFHSNSYIKHLPLKSMEHTGKFQIEIWFLSESSSGLLIYSEHLNSKKGHMKLFIERKMIIFNMIIGSQTISLSSRYPIELNRWHQCLLEIHGQKLMLILDQEPPVISYELFSSSILWPRSFTFIGYLPNRYRSNNSSLFEGFHGAIQKIIVNDYQTFDDLRINAFELFNITAYHGYPCQPNPCLYKSQCHPKDLNNYTCEDQYPRRDVSLEFDGTINTIYPYKPSNINRNYFDLFVKTKYSLGLIFYIGETSLSFFSNYLSLILVDGFVQFTAKFHMNSTAVLLKSKVRIDDGRWHRIEIERFRRRIILKLDDHHRYQTVLSSRETEFSPNPSYIYIGGYHRLCSYDEQHCRSYRGCLKDLMIDHQSIHLINDELNQHRLLKQCHDLI